MDLTLPQCIVFLHRTLGHAFYAVNEKHEEDRKVESVQTSHLRQRNEQRKQYGWLQPLVRVLE